MLLAAATRLTRLGCALPVVTKSVVSAIPPAFSCPAIRPASFRLKANSGTLRALIAPSDSAVCPTSTTILNFAGSHVTAADFEAADFDASDFDASDFDASDFDASDLALRGFGAAARFDFSSF